MTIQLQRYTRLLLAFGVGLAVPYACVHADAGSADVAFRWDYQTAGASGFVLYCGASSQWYTTRYAFGNIDTAHIALAKGSVHFCSVTAYDAEGLESRFSNEVAIAVTDGAPPSVMPPITVEPGTDSLMLTPTGFRVRFNRPFDLNVLDLLWAEGWLDTPDIALVDAKKGFVAGSVVPDPDNRGFTFVKTRGVLAAGSYSLLIRSRPQGLVDEFGRPLDGNGDGVFGDDFILSFAIPPGNEPILSIDEFARGPGQPVRLPAGNPAGGIPIRMTNGSGVTDVEFTLRYSPSNLRLLGIRPGANLRGDITVATIDSTTGKAHIRLARLGGLTDAVAELLILDAEVPMEAVYRSTHVLDITELRLNGGTIPGKDDDGVHVVAYLGDTTGNGSYSSLDLSRLQALILGTDRGLAAYPLIDPVLIGDVTGNGSITSLDMSRLSDWIRSGLDSAVRPEFEAMPVIP
jgi:hypothetical protein